MQTKNFWLEETFKSFKPFWIFCINPWHGSQNSINVSRVKVAGEIVFFYFSFQSFFRMLSEKKFQTFGQKTSKSCQNYLLRVQRNNLWLEFFFLIWIVLDFPQKPLSWFSKVYLRVQNKNCGRNSFLIFLFRIFFGLWAKIFSHFFPKNFKVLSELHSACPEEQFVTWIYFSVLNLFWVFCRNFWHASQISIYVSRVEIAEKSSFFCFSFQNFFGIWAKSFSDFWPKNFKKLSKLTSVCADEQFLAWRNF